jgi:antitoxin Phd
MAKWQVQEAKAKFSELMVKAEEDGPQVITSHGKERVVMISTADYDRLSKRKPDFKTFLLESGPKFEDFEIERELDYGRDIDLSDLDVSEFRKEK